MREEKPKTTLREHFDVILPAGGRITGDFAQMAGTEVKALISLDGQTILKRTIEALQATKRVGRLVVIGPPAALEEAGNAGVEGQLAEGASGPDNILSGLKWLQQTSLQETSSQQTSLPQTASQNPSSQATARVLIVTTDLPFLTAQTLNTFLDACPAEADVAIPILTQQEYETRFPGTVNEFVRLKDGSFTIGSVFMLNSATLLQIETHLRALFEARKNQWQTARLVGFSTILQFATRQLTIARLEARVSAIAKCHGVAVQHMPAELAYDIDHSADFIYAREHLPNKFGVSS